MTAIMASKMRPASDVKGRRWLDQYNREAV